MKFAELSTPQSLSDVFTRVRSRRASVVACVFVLAIGCSGATSPADLPPCQGPVTVSVSSGTVPLFSWAPRCLAGQLAVTTISGYVTYWIVTGTGNTLQPSVRYGIPRDTSSLGLYPLQVGGTYTVHVLRATGDSAAPFQAIGSTNFTP